jgi:hypothetical protein
MEADVQEVNTQELKDRMGQIETEIKFRKQNGLDTTELEDEQTELDLQVLSLGSNSDPFHTEEYNGPTIWDYLDKEVTDAQLLGKIDGFLAQIQEAWDAKNWEALHGLLITPFLDVYLASDAYFTGDKIGDVELTDPVRPKLETKEDCVTWVDQVYELFVSCLKQERDAIWSHDYKVGVQRGTESFYRNSDMLVCMECGGFVKSERDQLT